ncbi:MAG: addiction module toxin, HicA family [SAR202 cluster bacterium]|nr:addiction module toxin, HicA family [SAR202 cluster bacterium]
MNRGDLLRRLQQHGCCLKREGSSHSLWCSPVTGAVEAVSRHVEIANVLARKICRNLSVPEIGRE